MPLDRLHLQAKPKMMVLCLLVGLIAGAGAVIFHFLCHLFQHVFLGQIAGYYPSHPAGEIPLFAPKTTIFRRYLLFFIPAFGGLLSGFFVYKFAPEAEGHGTDAVIEAYHRRKGIIRPIVPIIKTIASAFTLGTGGSGGREGPIAQIGGGFGSYLSKVLKLSERERRILLAAGMGAGIGSIFRAPLAGALFSAEVLYRDLEFESEVIIPAAISSVVAYCLFSKIYGWGSLFSTADIHFHNPFELFHYAIMAFVLAGMSIIYVRSFYGVQTYFKNLKIPNHFKPALGGIATGIIGFFLPETLGFGYGFIQEVLNEGVTLDLLLLVSFGKIFTTSFSIGSGGSGGVFGPSMVIGASLGGAIGKVFHQISPEIVRHTSPYVVVGMAGFFSAVSKSPISTIIFVSEMTNSYHLFLPSLLVCSLSFLLSRKSTIYSQQVPTKLDSPVHRGEFLIDVLQNIKVHEAYTPMNLVKIPEDMPLREIIEVISNTNCYNYPVVSKDGTLVGFISLDDIRGILLEEDVYSLIIAKDLVQPNPVTVTPDETLAEAMKKFASMDMRGNPVEEIPVVKDRNSYEIIGILTRRNLLAAYSRQMESRSRLET